MSERVLVLFVDCPCGPRPMISWPRFLDYQSSSWPCPCPAIHTSASWPIGSCAAIDASHNLVCEACVVGNSPAPAHILISPTAPGAPRLSLIHVGRYCTHYLVKYPGGHYGNPPWVLARSQKPGRSIPLVLLRVSVSQSFVPVLYQPLVSPIPGLARSRSNSFRLILSIFPLQPLTKLTLEGFELC